MVIYLSYEDWKFFKNVVFSRNSIFQDGGHDNCLTVRPINFIIYTHILHKICYPVAVSFFN